MKPGDPASGLLPASSAGDGGKPGEGDRRVQAYNFRLCMTHDAGEPVPCRQARGATTRRSTNCSRAISKPAAGRHSELARS